MSTIRPKSLTPRRDVPTIVVVNPGDSKVNVRATTADILGADISLSRMHARLTTSAGGELSAQHLDGTDGMFVNSARQGTARIGAGNRLMIGAIEFIAVDRP